MCVERGCERVCVERGCERVCVEGGCERVCVCGGVSVCVWRGGGVTHDGDEQRGWAFRVLRDVCVCVRARARAIAC